jgi:DNA polymerase-1
LKWISDESSEETTINITKHYRTLNILIRLIPRLKLLLQNLSKQSSVCFDTETTGLDALHAELVGISFS